MLEHILNAFIYKNNYQEQYSFPNNNNNKKSTKFEVNLLKRK